MLAMPELLHGEAVNVDMALSVLLSGQRGAMSIDQQERVFALMRRLNLPLFHPLCDPALLERALGETVRHRDGRQRLPLGVGIGAACFVNDLRTSELEAAAASLRKLARAYPSVPRERWAAHG
jgi:3-dehydroquinate synthetase